MSSDGCSCGSSCKCGDSCSCGESRKFPDLRYSEKITTAIMISGIAPVNRYHTGSNEMNGSEGGNACKCGSNCSCDPCKC